MAYRITANSTIQARLFQPPRQNAVSLRTVYKLGHRAQTRPAQCPLILNSRSFSESTSTPPLPKDSGSAQASRSSEREDKKWFSPEAKNQIGARAKVLWGALATGGVVGAGSVFMSFENMLITKESHRICYQGSLAPRLVQRTSEICTRICSRICTL